MGTVVAAVLVGTVLGAVSIAFWSSEERLFSRSRKKIKTMNKVLIVDDEKEIADLVEIYLENDGYQVYKFYNGEDALNCIHNNDIDLAILDIMLPAISTDSHFVVK